MQQIWPIASTALSILLPLALAAATGAAPVAALSLLRLAGISLKARQAAVLAEAVTAAAHGMYTYLVTNKKSVFDRDAMSTALKLGTTHVLAAAPATLDTLGVTPDAVVAHVQNAIMQRFGGVLAADPTITVVNPTVAAGSIRPGVANA